MPFHGGSACNHGLRTFSKISNMSRSEYTTIMIHGNNRTATKSSVARLFLIIVISFISFAPYAEARQAGHSTVAHTDAPAKSSQEIHETHPTILHSLAENLLTPIPMCFLLGIICKLIHGGIKIPKEL